MTNKVALITGVTGQDGAYLAEHLLNKGYIVHGIKRRSSTFNSGRVDHLYRDLHEPDVRFKLHYGDLTDGTNLIRIIQEVRPSEIYNLAAQSHVQVSFEAAEYTANADALGTLRLLEAIRILGLEKSVRFYQASTSEMFGKVREVPQSETTHWGHARDYVEGMWLMLQQDEPDDYVLATGEARSVREFVEAAFAHIGRHIEWRGEGLDEIGIEKGSGNPLVTIDPRYFRPTEVDQLLGDPAKAQRKLGWKHRIGFKELVGEMMKSDLQRVPKARQRYGPE